MSLDMLIGRFDQVIHTPADLEKLRSAVLDWAVRGLLNTQNPNDSSVDDLVENIMSQRQAMIRNNGQVKSKKLAPIKPSEIPYELPENWCWVRLPAVYYTHGQKKPDSTFTYIDVSSIDNERGTIGSDLQVIEAIDAPSRARKLVSPGTVIYSTVRPYLLNIAIVEEVYDPQAIVSTAFAVMHPFQGVLNRYLYYYLRSPSFTTFVEGQMTGMAYPAISDSKLNKGLFPLPPFEEQKRIVARVKELRAQVYELASFLSTAESQRKKFHTAVIHKLTEAKTPKETGAAWHLIRDNFDRLYTEPETIDELKQTILQLAVMGHLVPQDRNDEPAEVLLERITVDRKGKWENNQKAVLIKRAQQRAAKIMRENSGNPLQKGEKLHLDEWQKMPDDEYSVFLPRNESWKKRYKEATGPNEDELPELPVSWTWATVGQLTWLVKDGPHFSPKYTDSGIPFISTRNVSPTGVDFTSAKFISLELHAELSERCNPETGDILYTKGGTTGIACVNTYDLEFNVWVHVAVLKLVDSVNPFYLKTALNSPHCYSQAQKLTHGSGNQDLGLTRLVNITVPLPPLEEQERIVTKVDDLLELLRVLAEQLRTTEKGRGKFLDAILAEAVAH